MTPRNYDSPGVIGCAGAPNISWIPTPMGIWRSSFVSCSHCGDLFL